MCLHAELESDYDLPFLPFFFLFFFFSSDIQLPEGEFRKPDDSKHSEHVKEPQLDRQSSSKEVKGTTSIKPLHKDDNVDSNTDNMQGETNASSISSSDSGSSEGYTTAKVRRQNRITPCIIVIDLLE